MALWSHKMWHIALPTTHRWSDPDSLLPAEKRKKCMVPGTPHGLLECILLEKTCFTATQWSCVGSMPSMCFSQHQRTMVRSAFYYFLSFLRKYAWMVASWHAGAAMRTRHVSNVFPSADAHFSSSQCSPASVSFFFFFFLRCEQWGWFASPISYHQCYVPLHCCFKGPLFSRVCCKIEISNSRIASKTFQLIGLVQATGSGYPPTLTLKNARPHEFFELSGISKYPI